MTVEEEFTVAIWLKDKIYVLVGEENGGLSFDNAIHRALKFTREKAEELKKVIQWRNPNYDVCVMQMRAFY